MLFLYHLTDVMCAFGCLSPVICVDVCTCRYRATPGLIREVCVDPIRPPNSLPSAPVSVHRTDHIPCLAWGRRYVRVTGDIACEMVDVPDWTDFDVHAMVAGFLRARFPILVAANKADLLSAADNLSRLRKECRDEAVVAVSAQSECTLQALHKKGSIRYTDGDASFEVLDASGVSGDALDWIKAKVLIPHGSTGCLEAISQAVQLRPPVLAFPVGNIDTLEPMVRPPRADLPADVSGSDTGERDKTTEPAVDDVPVDGRLYECLLMRPGSLIEDLYNSLKHLNLLDGDYVRAEALVAMDATDSTSGAKKRVVRKDDPLDGLLAVRVMTNRKVRWQDGRHAAE